MPQKPDTKEAPEVDRLPGVPLPREQDQLIGHTRVEQALLDAYRSKRMHHALILGGPKGIGKATLAFRFARFVIAHPDRFGPQTAQATDLGLSESDPVARQVAAGGHPNLLHLRRPWDEKAKRFKSDLPVDEVRRTVTFFGTTASASAWRVCIVDAADDMNASSANALLKILEEPPARCLFLVLSHAPGRLLPTIRSRCRRLDLAPLSDDEIANGLKALASGTVPSGTDLSDITRFADGSLRSALTLLAGDGLAIAKGFAALVDPGRATDLAAVHGLADLVAARGQSDNWASFQHVARAHLHLLLKSAARAPDRAPRDLAALSDLWDRTNRAIADADALNLDRKQVVLDLVRDVTHLSPARV
ncbi:MAG: DNA polymerase III subunit delta' [Roseibium sp.]|nr:DNA polymerase III subunit delta' [Roseibium sp.]